MHPMIMEAVALERVQRMRSDALEQAQLRFRSVQNERELGVAARGISTRPSRSDGAPNRRGLLVGICAAIAVIVAVIALATISRTSRTDASYTVSAIASTCSGQPAVPSVAGARPCTGWNA